MGTNLYVFQLAQGQTPATLAWLKEYHHDWDVTGYTILPAEAALEFKVTFTPDENTPNTQTYGWNAETGQFDLLDEQKSAQQKRYEAPATDLAELKMLKEWNLAEAIPLLQAAVAYPEVEDRSYEQDLRPRLHYLLGLAYELNGDAASAVQTYWRLWHAYPGSPYALMARAKLQPAAP